VLDEIGRDDHSIGASGPIANTSGWKAVKKVDDKHGCGGIAVYPFVRYVPFIVRGGMVGGLVLVMP